jgi:hypothetical protein
MHTINKIQPTKPAHIFQKSMINITWIPLRKPKHVAMLHPYNQLGRNNQSSLNQTSHTVSYSHCCFTQPCTNDTKKSVNFSLSSKNIHLQNLVCQSTLTMIQPININRPKQLSTSNPKLLTGFNMLPPVLGNFSGLPLGILGEYNTRRNKNSSVMVRAVFNIKSADLPRILHRTGDRILSRLRSRKALDFHSYSSPAEGYENSLHKQEQLN